ncbi:MAG: uncharacterized protein K0S75_471 [Clostridia bacterium]|jgi:hypothetical protein|nr:uncharacterized protein [Clostridia bacterium]
MRKIMSFILVITIILTMSVPAVSAVTSIGLKDILINGKAHWAKVYIDKLIDKLIITGYPDGTFKPDNNVEVDSYIKMVVIALGNKFENGKDYWASPYINKAIELKLIDSNEFNTYRRAITREEAAKVIVQALATLEQLPSAEEINKYKSVVPDYAKISEKYMQHALTAYATGIITGDPKGNFKPIDNLSRAEAATVIMRLLDKTLRKPIPVQEEVTTVLPELLKSDEEVWGREDIYDVTSSAGLGVYRGTYAVDNGKIYFNATPRKEEYEGYELDTKLNPDIREQVYNATKVLIDDDHYVLTTYSTDEPTRVHVALAKASQYAYNDSFFFHYIFFEKVPYNAKKDWQEDSFSDKIYISLSLYRLLWKSDNNNWSTPYYETKLKHSLIAIFGESEGTDIYNYIYSVYVDKRINDTKYLNKCFTKTFKTVKIDFGNDDSSTLDFYFSKIK